MNWMILVSFDVFDFALKPWGADLSGFLHGFDAQQFVGANVQCSGEFWEQRS